MDYMSRARVTPKLLGSITIRILNINPTDVKLPPRTRLGKLTQPRELVNIDKTLHWTVRELNVVEEINIDNDVTESEKITLENLLSK